MKNKIWIIAMLIFPFITTSCHKDPVQKDIRFSILGDSYSTFEGHVTPSSNDVWYKLPPHNFIDVTVTNEKYLVHFYLFMRQK